MKAGKTRMETGLPLSNLFEAGTRFRTGSAPSVRWVQRSRVGRDGRHPLGLHRIAHPEQVKVGIGEEPTIRRPWPG